MNSSYLPGQDTPTAIGTISTTLWNLHEELQIIRAAGLSAERKADAAAAELVTIRSDLTAVQAQVTEMHAAKLQQEELEQLAPSSGKGARRKMRNTSIEVSNKAAIQNQILQLTSNITRNSCTRKPCFCLGSSTTARKSQSMFFLTLFTTAMMHGSTRMVLPCLIRVGTAAPTILSTRPTLIPLSISSSQRRARTRR